MFKLLLCGIFAETLEGIDMGDTTHKKPGTTVPESIHSFSELKTVVFFFPRFRLSGISPIVISDGSSHRALVRVALNSALLPGAKTGPDAGRHRIMLFLFMFCSWRWFGPT